MLCFFYRQRYCRVPLANNEDKLVGVVEIKNPVTVDSIRFNEIKWHSQQYKRGIYLQLFKHLELEAASH